MSDSNKFLNKLYEILNESQDNLNNRINYNLDNKDIISWEKGEQIINNTNTNNITPSICTSFTIHNKSLFISKILPYYFMHKNFANFTRQLNLYSFKKIKGKDTYIHEYFSSEKNSIQKVNRKSTNPIYNLLVENKKKEENSHVKQGNTQKTVGNSNTTDNTPNTINTLNNTTNIMHKIPNKNQISHKLNFLINKNVDLETKMDSLFEANEKFLDDFNFFTNEIEKKSKYINNLEGLLFFIIEKIMPKRSGTTVGNVSNVNGSSNINNMNIANTSRNNNISAARYNGGNNISYPMLGSNINSGSNANIPNSNSFSSIEELFFKTILNKYREYKRKDFEFNLNDNGDYSMYNNLNNLNSNSNSSNMFNNNNSNNNMYHDTANSSNNPNNNISNTRKRKSSIVNISKMLPLPSSDLDYSNNNNNMNTNNNNNIAIEESRYNNLFNNHNTVNTTSNTNTMNDIPNTPTNLSTMNNIDYMDIDRSDFNNSEINTNIFHNIHSNLLNNPTTNNSNTPFDRNNKSLHSAYSEDITNNFFLLNKKRSNCSLYSFNNNNNNNYSPNNSSYYNGNYNLASLFKVDNINSNNLKQKAISNSKEDEDSMFNFSN